MVKAKSIDEGSVGSVPGGLGQSPTQASLHDAKVVSARRHEVSSLIMSVTGNKPLTQETDLQQFPFPLTPQTWQTTGVCLVGK